MQIFVALIIAGPICLGAWMVVFSRRFSVHMFRFRETVFKMRFTEFEIRVGQVYAVVVGAGLLIGGLIVAAQLLFP